MRIGIIDADLLGRDKHRFPNLACEKISGYWKEQGAEVLLLADYNHFDDYDHVYISKVFTDTPVPEWLEETLGIVGMRLFKKGEIIRKIKENSRQDERFNYLNVKPFDTRTLDHCIPLAVYCQFGDGILD